MAAGLGRWRRLRYPKCTLCDHSSLSCDVPCALTVVRPDRTAKLGEMNGSNTAYCCLRSSVIARVRAFVAEFGGREKTRKDA